MPIQVDIRGVLDALGSSEDASGQLPLSDIALGDRAFSFAEPGSYSVTLTNTGGSIVGTGVVSATAHTECARCLCELEMPVTGEVQGFYVHPGHDQDVPEEQEIEYIHDERVDIEPAVMQALVVALPFAPLHAEDCRGLCPTCGVDLNVEECDCEPVGEGSPLAALKDLLGDESGEAAEGE